MGGVGGISLGGGGPGNAERRTIDWCFGLLFGVFLGLRYPCLEKRSWVLRPVFSAVYQVKRVTLRVWGLGFRVPYKGPCTQQLGTWGFSASNCSTITGYVLGSLG